MNPGIVTDSANSSTIVDLPKDVLAHDLSTHPDIFRFILWQQQFKLISHDPRSWTTTWNDFYHTYAFLQNSCDISPQHNLIHAIHVDVVRLSRYRTEFGDANEYPQHLKRLERILYVFARYTSHDGYHQGYHEMLAILYYVTIKGGIQLGLDLDHCEAIAYFLLHGLINGTIVEDFFSNHENSLAMNKICHQATKVLAQCDEKLARAMDSKGIEPELFALNWINILFAQTYALKIVLILWDFLFAHLENLANILAQVVVAHIISMRAGIIGQTFISAMTTLTRFEVQTEAKFTDIFRGLPGASRRSSRVWWC
jgi:hypothetical protein